MGSATTIGAGSISRRVFLRGGASVAVAVAVPVSFARKAMAATQGSLTRSRFVPFVGATFRMTGGADNLDVVLAGVNDLSPVLRAADENRFALMFHAPRGHPRSEGIRTFHNDKFGDIALFVATVDRGVETVHYEAVINRS